MSDSGAALAVEGLSKTFPGQRALDDVSFDVRRGEVHALCGENGSGKSTLIKCLSGFHEPDEGSQIFVAGRPLAEVGEGPGSGMAFIHQELGLVPSLSVMENFALGKGFPTGGGRRIRWSEMAKSTRAVLEDFGHGEIDPRAQLGHLTQAQQTVVAIARALMRLDEDGGGHLLVLDEPTAALPPNEAERLFDAVRRATARGVGVVFVSHRLEEVFGLSDRITVLRDGRCVGTYVTTELTSDRLIEAIVGEPVEDFYRPPAAPVAPDEPVLRVLDLAGRRTSQVSFHVGKGEIVGIAGLLGSGRSEVLRLVFGAQARTAGEVELDGRPLTPKHPAEAIGRGVALVPEDRRTDAAFAEMSLSDNVLVTDLKRFVRGGRLRRKAADRHVTALIEEFNVRPASPQKPFWQFSGGNQQKAVLARWLPLGPRLIMLDEPVQGVDVGAKAEIFSAVERAAEGGAAVLMVNSDFEDLARVCHRVLVLQHGRLVQELTGADLDRHRIMAAVHARQEEQAHVHG